MAGASSNRPAIGIDLGTTNSCVAVFLNDKVEIIVNDKGNRTTPSYVAFTKVERLVGEDAKGQASFNAQNTIYDAKRLIGRRYDDPQIQEDLRLWPFKVRNEGGKPKIEVTYKSEKKVLDPEEISAMILGKMKKIAEDFLGFNIRNAVVTVPAYFNDSQRQATKDAGTIAGLNVLGIINEPTAGAIAYGLDRNFKGKKKVLVYDLGGGTFDVSILVLTEGPHFEVKATAGDTHLGGEDFDNRMVNFFVDEFKKRFKKDPSHDHRAIRRLKAVCEEAKKTLSSSTQTSINIDNFYDNKDFDMPISRARFEDLCLDLFQKTLEPVENALKDAKIDKEDIDDVILLGGSSRIPKVQRLLRDFFNGKKLNMSINPDEAVAFGAAIHAAVLNKDQSEVIKDLALVDVTPLSLGIGVIGNIVERIIERNTTIPVKKSKVFTTVEDNQTVVGIKVYEGERPMTWHNHLLGSFDLTGIPPARRGVPNILVTFDIDSNSILHVTACDEATSNKRSIRITNDKGRLTPEEIARMVQEAEKYNEDDTRQRQRLAAKRKLEAHAYKIKQIVETSGKNLTQAQRNRVIRECDDILDWLDNNNLVEVSELKSRKRELKEVCKPIFAKLRMAIDTDSDDSSDEEVH